MLTTIAKTGNGVNKDLLASELLPGQWSDCLNMRFRNEFAEKFKGISAGYTTPLVIPYTLNLYSIPNTRYLIESGIAKVYADDGTTQSEITRYGAGTAVSTLVHTTTTATLTTATAHGRTTGDTVVVYGAAPAAYDGTFVITVTSTTAFTYTMLSDPGANATALGIYSTTTTANFTGTRDDRITGGVLNGVLLLNRPVDGLFYWGGDVTKRLRPVPGYGNIADVARPFKNFIVFLGSTVSGIKNPHNVAWSKSADPGAIPSEFTASVTNDAGDVDLAETAGMMVDCLPWGNINIIYTQDARYAMQYIGGNDVFEFSRLPGNDGLIARNCVVNTPKGQVFMSNCDIRIHSGGDSVSIADGRVKNWIFSAIDATNIARSFLCVNPQKTEVWVVFPSYGKADCDTVAAWNWNSDAWGIRTIPNATCGTTGLISSTVGNGTYSAATGLYSDCILKYSDNEFSQNESRMLIATSAPKIGLVETGTTDFGVVTSWMLERQGLALDDPESIKVLSASRPQFGALPGTTVSIYHGSGMTADADPVYSAPATFIVGTTNWANSYAQGGRYLSIKMTSSDLPPVMLRSFDIDFVKQGRF